MLSDPLNLSCLSLNQKSKRQGFLENFVGFKYLFFDPFKKREKLMFIVGKLIMFQVKDLIPAISLTFETNVNFEKE